MRPARFSGNKKHFKVQQIADPGRSDDSDLSSEGEETDLEQKINFQQSDLLSDSGFSSSSDDNKESER